MCDVQVAEYLDIDAAVRMALEARPEAAATSEQVGFGVSCCIANNLATPALYRQLCAALTLYSDGKKVANRHDSGLARRGRKGSLNEGQRPTRSRRTCSPRYGLPSWRGESAAVAKRPRERSPTEIPDVTFATFPSRCRVVGKLFVAPAGSLLVSVSDNPEKACIGLNRLIVSASTGRNRQHNRFPSALVPGEVYADVCV